MIKVVALSALIAFTACEQNELIEPNSSGVKKSNTTNFDKSSDGIPGLQDFLDALLVDDDYPNNLLMEDAILNTEAALNYSLRNKDDDMILTDSMFVITTSLITDATNSSGQVTGEESYDFYHSVYDDIVNLGNSNYTGGHTYVYSIDISYHEDFDKSEITIYVNFGTTIYPSVCTLYGDYFAALKLGPCGSKPGTHQNNDAVREVNRVIQNRNCNTPMVRCGTTGWYDIITYPDPVHNPNTYWNTAKYYVSDLTAISCISENTFTNWYNNMMFYVSGFPQINAKNRQIDLVLTKLQERVRYVNLNRNDLYLNNIIQTGDCAFINDIAINKLIPMF